MLMEKLLVQRTMIIISIVYWRNIILLNIYFTTK